MKMKKTHYTVLGMLNIMPMTGYDIKKHIEQSINYFWKESFGQIYPVLNELHKNGMINMEIVGQDGKPDKKVYSIKEKGVDELKIWLQQPAAPDYLRSEFLMKIFFAKEMTGPEFKLQVEEYKLVSQKELDEYLEIEKSINEHLEQGFEEARYWLLTLEMGKKYSSMKIEWCNSVLKNFKP